MKIPWRKKVADDGTWRRQGISTNSATMAAILNDFRYFTDSGFTEDYMVHVVSYGAYAVIATHNDQDYDFAKGIIEMHCTK